jgi:penicillin-binding protein 2
MKSEFDFLYEKQLQTRIRIAYFIAAFIFGLLFLRLWFLQVVEGGEYRRLSENNRIRTQLVKAPRGFIFDRYGPDRGTILAGNRPSFDISLVPQDTRNPEMVLERLANLLGSDVSLLQQRLQQARGRPPFEPVKLKTDVSRDVLGLVHTHKLDLPGVIVETTPVRYYPQGKRASHLLGHLGEISSQELADTDFTIRNYKIGSFTGKSGVEQEMEFHLKGEDGGYQVEVNAVGYKVNIMGRIDPTPAHNVVLTINARLQKTAEEALEGKVGAIIAVDPQSGALLTMASSPTFDPNLFSHGISAQDWDDLINNPAHPLMNRCIQGMYPPGSTYKLVTAAAALEKGLVKPDERVYCGGSYTLGNRSYRCWKRPGHEGVALMKGIVESCDVYFYNLGSLLGPDLLARYAREFGFGLKTGIGLNNEKGGFIPTADWYLKRYGMPWQPGESLSIAIGQGSNQVTPLQLVMAYSALANGGILYKPFYINQVMTVEGKIIEHAPSPDMRRLPLSEETRELLKDTLWGAVNQPTGTGTLAAVPGRDVSGKTGTAQVVSLGKNAQSQKGMPLDHAWFVAYAPKEEARIAIVVFIEHGGHGGSAAAPIAKEVISRFFELEEEGSV